MAPAPDKLDADSRRLTLRNLSAAHPAAEFGKLAADHHAILLHTFCNARACRCLVRQLKKAGITPARTCLSRGAQVFVQRKDNQRSVAVLQASLVDAPDVRPKSFRRHHDLFAAEAVLAMIALVLSLMAGSWKTAVAFGVTYVTYRLLARRLLRHVYWFGSHQFNLSHLFGITALTAAIVAIWVWAVSDR